MTAESPLEILKKQLQKALLEKEVTFDDVLNLSNDIVKLDTENVRFSTDAGIIDRLGKELVGRQETAVCELVKNSYDADATFVNLIFEKFEVKGGVLTIEDDGNGMNRQELINGFMRLSSSDKITNPVSPLYKRKRAGRKGIGRFATQRLGKKLTIITQTATSESALKVEIDWNKFVQNVELISISNKIEEIPKDKEKGTTLKIELLEDSWTEASIKRIFRYLIDLIQPFPLSPKIIKQKKQEIEKDKDSGFDIKIFAKREGTLSQIASSEQNIFESAIAEIEGLVDKGEGLWTIKSKYLDVDESGQSINPSETDKTKKYQYLNDVYFKVYYFIIRKVDFISPMTASYLDEFLKERGGVRIYRNGFRVLPYGEQFNDWLRLDFNYARRIVLPPFSNENFFGFIEITDPEGQIFQETSSREGLIENEAFKELVNFVYKVLRSAAYRVAELRGRKKTASQKDWREKEKTPSEVINDVIGDLSNIVDQIEDKTSKENGDNSTSEPPPKIPLGDIKDKLKQLSDAKSQDDEDKAKLIEENSMLRVLAGLGLSIATFTHEVKHSFSAISSDSQHLINISTDKQREIAERLNQHLDSFRTYTAYFDRAVSENVHRELKIQDISRIARKFVEIMQPTAQKYGIKLHDPIEEGIDLFSCKMHWSEWMAMLLNFFTNSYKAIKRASEAKGEILIRCGKFNEQVFLEFSDNGDGVSPENQERIFEAFFTTSSPAGPMANDAEELLGTGLGLKIVKDTVVNYGGQIKLVEPPVGYSTCFRIEVPSATTEEINEHGY